MTKKTGKPFESFVKSVYDALTEDERFTSVEMDVKLPGPDGPRQIDVLLRSRIAHFDLLTIIECRDYSGRLDITHVDGFHSKLCDVKANKGIMVSRVGFSKNAREKAKRVGIALCVASTADDLLPKLGIQIPIEVTDIKLSTFGCAVSIDVHTPTTLKMKEMLTINGLFIPEVPRSDLIDSKIPVPQSSTNIRWAPSTLEPPYVVSDSSGRKYQLEALEFSVEVEVRRYFGHIHEIPSILVHQEVESSTITMILRSEDLPGLVDNLSEFSFSAEKHVDPVLKVDLISLPESFDNIPWQVSLRKL
jgi:hypothetical protein